MISKTCGYGIRGVVLLAVKMQEGGKIGIQVLAEALDAPQPFLSKIMQDLARRGIIHSMKGPGGGFYVSPDILSLPLIKIVEAIDGLEIFRKCYLGREECSEARPCPLHHDFADYREGIIRTFQVKTIGDLVKEVQEEQTFLKIG